MRLADALTATRIVLAPTFFFAFFLGEWAPRLVVVSTLAAALSFGLMEVSDLLDGYLARRTHGVSDFGKLLDPFADSVSRITYFACFAAVGLMPFWILLVVIYRDLGVSFARLVAARRGVSMGARFTGKVKAWVYGLAGLVGIVRLVAIRLLIPGAPSDILSSVSTIAFLACAAIAAGSLIDYLLPVFLRK